MYIYSTTKPLTYYIIMWFLPIVGLFMGIVLSGQLVDSSIGTYESC